MKTALLHYWLTNMRGGEKVLAALGEMLPQVDIFTHAYIPANVPAFDRFEVTESFIAKLPFGRKHPQAYLPFMPVAARTLKLDGYDLIVSSESGPIKGIRKPKGARHICYCHTPMRYIWDMYDAYYRTAGIGGKIAMKVFTPYMRKEDLKSAESVDTFIANSAFVAARIRRVYGRTATVVHPPVDVDFFSGTSRLPPDFRWEPGSYYLYAGELRDYKRPDLAVEACLGMNRKLVIVGNGKMHADLVRRIGTRDNVVFAGRVSDDDLRGFYAHARAQLFPGTEDFGIVPVEAQAAGTPVVAFGAGGALESVVDGKTGVFFEEQTAASLCGALERFEAGTWSREACRAQARRFSPAVFKSRMTPFLFQ